MELFIFEIIRREQLKFNVSVDSSVASQLTAATADINYDNAHNRCTYLYRRGIINVYFAKDCFKKFLSEYKNAKGLLNQWKNTADLCLCSISKGPALDYIAFVLSCKESGFMSHPLFSNIKVVSKYGAWRNTVNILQEVVKDGYLKSLGIPATFGTFETIQGDPLKDFTQKVKSPICNSDVILMMKSFNLQTDGFSKKDLFHLKEFLGALKPGAVVFCIDTKPSIKAVTEQLVSFPGKYLMEPTFIATQITAEYPDVFKEHFGCFPAVSARGSFFVWQKSTTPSSAIDFHVIEVSKSLEQLLKIKNEGPKEKSSNQVVKSKSSVKSAPESSESKHIDLLTSPIARSLSNFSSNSSQDSSKLTDQEYLVFPPLNPPSNQVLNSSLVDKHTQTDMKENLSETVENKIKELTSKINYLTTSLVEMLEINAQNGYISSDYPNNPKLPNHFSQFLGENDASNSCCCSNSPVSQVPVANISVTGPQLVIPLNNFPPNVLAEIISLATKSSQNSD